MDRAAKALEQWRRERPDLDVSPMGVIGRLNEVSTMIMRDRLTPVFARFGLQAGEFDVLATLRRSGAPYALTPTELYEATMVTSGAMTARLDRLEKIVGMLATVQIEMRREGFFTCEPKTRGRKISGV